MENIFVYSKTFRSKNGSVFSKLKGSTRGFAFDINLSKDADKKLSEKGLSFPIELTLEDKDYFIKRKSYTSRDGEEKIKDIIVIKDFQEAKQGGFTTKTLSDLVAERASEK